MKRKLVFSLAAALLAFPIAFFVLRAIPTLRTEAYFVLHRAWQAHWPFQRGSLPPPRFRALFVPFVPVRIELEPHVSMLLDPEDLVSRVILETGEWEPDSWREVREHLTQGGTFIDVGAHIGYYSLKAARVVGPNGKVIAIEPNPETITKLRDNIRASGSSFIKVEPVACADTEGVLDLFAAARGNTGETSLARSNAMQSGDVVATYRVRARPLDSMLEEDGIKRIDAIKIDVEGAELLVLKGAQAALTRSNPILVIEIVDKQLRAMGTSSVEVTQFLASLGYKPHHQLGTNIEFER